MSPVFLVAIGGALGSVGRYLVGAAMLRRFGSNFPWGTLTVNVTGCFAIGAVAALLTRMGGHDTLRLFIITGILGGFTTFSAFSLETVTLIEAGRLMAACAYVAASLAISGLAVLAGLALLRAMG
ncbi:hypothetical protein BJF93_22230 [Xaviernesmea oryzae]|uniref:Fluoride-specific ion channel FluC n=1 Tax=Xaviernesmea oryzae TaxID=464029 RepID=A0A1Q9AYK5_9HYPH|nr:fluoride efflux transporter CrcB [Xaviernesmea oryzae]OLP60532.1 hypothetical protein BJF93_22230 [Xaviernesmea oryzae]SEM29310.1 CrcB protein [Xaviernesmea oryzae]